MTAAEPFAELAGLAVTLAEGAAGVVRAGRAGTFTVDTKSSRSDLVTEVDRRTEAWLVEQIVRVRPGDAILGEEGPGRDGTSGVRWLLDPIDGTMNFVLGLPQYGVSVAAEADGVVVAGAVCNPATGETFRALRGGGAFLGERRLTGPRGVPLDRAIVATGFGYDPDVRARQAAAVAALITRVADIRRLGSAALDLCFVAAGRVDAYFEAGLNPWDYAAGALIAAEAGCVVSGARGTAVSGEFVIASESGMAGELTELLATTGADTARTLSR